jgi:dTDP-4-amino-4,6-dideoxygalactose transaminase
MDCISRDVLIGDVSDEAPSKKPKLMERKVLTKNIKAVDPIPQAGIDAAVGAMSSGVLYRYNVTKAAESLVSNVEVELAAYTGHKYCVGLNSCGSAMYLMLMAAGVKPGDSVMTNAFTFTAVPSAVVHAMAKTIYIETTSNYTMDLNDLKLKIESSGAKFLLISHMRGKVADMDEVKAICDKAGVMLLEDCAHSLGVRFGDGSAASKHCGHHGVACCISSQSYKMLNSGEGGFYLTDDATMAAKVAVYAGAYEGLSAKHLAVPSQEIFGNLPNELPCLSLRMSNLTAAVIRPQIATLEERVEKYNERYVMVDKRLNNHFHITIPKPCPKVRICGDSLQFNLLNLSDEQVQKFLSECHSHGLFCELFGAKGNARNFENWKFSPADCPLPKTCAVISRAIDIRLPLTWEDQDFEDVCTVVEESLTAALATDQEIAVP